MMCDGDYSRNIAIDAINNVVWIHGLPSQRDSPMSAQAIGLGPGHRHDREPQRGDTI